MHLSKRAAIYFLLLAAFLFLSADSAICETANIKKSVLQMDDGRYLIKLKIKSLGRDIYGLRLVDPQASIIDVYAPKGWCSVTDGEDYLARTSSKPITKNTSVEFIIHSGTDDIQYTWSVYNRLEQLGKPSSM